MFTMLKRAGDPARIGERKRQIHPSDENRVR
jgi:hypothetical protein